MNNFSKKPLRTLKKVVALIALTISISPLAAWDGVIGGTISGIDVASVGSNYGFRIYLSGVTEMCGPGTPPWAFINSDATNYQAVTSVLLTAYSTGRPVGLYTNKSGPYCGVGYVTLR